MAVKGMAHCKECKEFFKETDLVEGYCSFCAPQMHKEKLQMHKEKLQVDKVKLTKENTEKNLALDSIIITTETYIDIPIEERIEVVFLEYVYGLNIVKDFFTAIRDIVGGRVKSIEQPIQDTNKKIIREMKEKAYNLGGDAVIGLKIDYSTYTSMISIVAVGTVVKLKKLP